MVFGLSKKLEKKTSTFQSFDEASCWSGVKDDKAETNERPTSPSRASMMQKKASSVAHLFSRSKSVTALQKAGAVNRNFSSSNTQDESASLSAEDEGDQEATANPNTPLEEIARPSLLRAPSMEAERGFADILDEVEHDPEVQAAILEEDSSYSESSMLETEGKDDAVVQLMEIDEKEDSTTANEETEMVQFVIPLQFGAPKQCTESEVHGLPNTEDSFSQLIRPSHADSSFSLLVPSSQDVSASQIEVLASAEHQELEQSSKNQQSQTKHTKPLNSVKLSREKTSETEYNSKSAAKRQESLAEGSERGCTSDVETGPSPNRRASDRISAKSRRESRTKSDDSKTSQKETSSLRHSTRRSSDQRRSTKAPKQHTEDDSSPSRRSKNTERSKSSRSSSSSDSGKGSASKVSSKDTLTSSRSKEPIPSMEDESKAACRPSKTPERSAPRRTSSRRHVTPEGNENGDTESRSGTNRRSSKSPTKDPRMKKTQSELCLSPQQKTRRPIVKKADSMAVFSSPTKGSSHSKSAIRGKSRKISDMPVLPETVASENKGMPDPMSVSTHSVPTSAVRLSPSRKKSGLSQSMHTSPTKRRTSRVSRFTKPFPEDGDKPLESKFLAKDKLILNDDKEQAGAPPAPLSSRERWVDVTSLKEDLKSGDEEAQMEEAAQAKQGMNKQSSKSQWKKVSAVTKLMGTKNKVSKQPPNGEEI